MFISAKTRSNSSTKLGNKHKVIITIKGLFVKSKVYCLKGKLKEVEILMTERSEVIERSEKENNNEHLRLVSFIYNICSIL